MRICADLGCIQESRMLPRQILDGNTTVRWEEKYALSPVAFDLPEAGSEKKDLLCPVCGGKLDFKVTSVARLHLQYTLAFWLIVFVVAGLGGLFLAAGDETMRTIGMIVFAVAAALGLGALAFMMMKPDFLTALPDVLQLTADEARETNDSEGFSGRKGHKLFKIRRA